MKTSELLCRLLLDESATSKLLTTQSDRVPQSAVEVILQYLCPCLTGKVVSHFSKPVLIS